MNMTKLFGITVLIAGLFAFGALTRPALANISADEGGGGGGGGGCRPVSVWVCGDPTPSNCMADAPGYCFQGDTTCVETIVCN